MIPIYQPYLTGREQEYVNMCLESSWISSKGEFISRFESQFATHIGLQHATSVCNGSAALHLAMQALGLKIGDEVIVPTLTYVASVNSIVQTGGTPVFVDCLESTWQMDAEDIRRKITPRTKAVMAVHLYGLPCNLNQLVALAKEYNLYLIEDCAEAFGSQYNGQHVGTFGDVATFSFYGNKTITTGEGGMVVARDEAIVRRAHHLKTQGVSPVKEYWHDVIGYNYRMTNICAAIGVAQLESADEILQKKRQVAKWYKQKLQGLPIKTQTECVNARHSFWMYSILVDQAEQRDPLREALMRSGVETRPVFHPIHTLPPYQQDESFPIAELLSRCGISLPSWPGLTEDLVEQVCAGIWAYYDQLDSGAAISGKDVLL